MAHASKSIKNSVNYGDYLLHRVHSDIDAFVNVEILLLTIKHYSFNLHLVLILIQNSPQLIVGFQASVHTYNDTSKQYGLKQIPLLANKQYSFVSTAICFTHVHYLHMYTYKLPRQLFNFVAKYDNCEDIFFNGMVAEFLGSNGSEQPHCIWVKGHIEGSENNEGTCIVI